MFSHVMIGTNDLEKAKSFYDALLGTLGVPPAGVDRHRIFYRTPTGTFSVSLPIDGKPATPANGGTLGFAAASPEQAEAWHAAGSAMAARPAKTRPASAKPPWVNSTLLICAIPTATSSAPCARIGKANNPGRETAMRIAVIGAGGVGGGFGVALAKAGADVTFVARGAHLAAMEKCRA